MPMRKFQLVADGLAGRAGVRVEAPAAATLEELREKLKAWRIQQGEDLGKVPMPEDARTGRFPYAE